MSEELLQRDLVKNPEKIGKWDFYNIGATTVKALKEYGIIRNVNYGAVEKKKVDALIVQRKNVIAVIEYKKPSEFKTEAQKKKAIKQEIEVAKKLGAKIFIATDTKESVWVNAFTGNRIGDENRKEIKVLFDTKDENISDLIKVIYDSINERTDNIKLINFVNPTNLAKSIWQDIWSVSGATPENCLYTFVELFIFKYLSDLDVLKGTHNFYTLMKMYDENTEDEVLEHYADTIRKKIKALFPENLTDKTTIINGTIFVSKDQKAVKGYSTTFKTVLDKFNKYGKLKHIDYDFKSQLFESFLKESISKKNWGQFFTPLKVIRPIIKMAKDDIKDGVKMCDPACGVGKFLLEPLATKLEDFYKISKKGIFPKITIHGFDKGFDKDEQKTIILAKANMLIYFSDLIKNNPGQTKDFAELFNNSFTLKTNSILGTLSEPVEEEYDLILTNPPYVTSGSGNLKDEIKKDGDLVNYYKINATGVEGLFMEWIVRALKPGGRAFVVVPDGVLSNKNKNLKQFILEECCIDGIISLPIKTFFTTQKKTYIIVITKKINKKETQKDPVFTYLVSEIGETRDIYRFDLDKNDLQEAVALYSFFKGNKKGFEKINSDKRCKIQPISKFNPNNDWTVDTWWTDDEKIELGIIEKENTIQIEEFPDFLEDIATNILAYKEDVSELNDGGKLEIEYKETPIGKIFTLPPIKGVTAKYIQSNQGKIPVYGGKIKEIPIGYIKDNLGVVKYFENCLAWNREGSVGYVFWHKHRFSTNDHHRPMTVKPEYADEIDLLYMKYIIQETLLKQGFRWSKTASKEKVAKIIIAVPINEDGTFNLQAQKQISEKYRKIESIKSAINVELNKISETDVNF